MLMPEEVQNALALDTTNHWELSGTFPVGLIKSSADLRERSEEINNAWRPNTFLHMVYV